MRHRHLAHDPLPLSIRDQVLEVPSVRQFPVSEGLFLQLLEIGRLFDVGERVTLGALTIDTSKLAHIVLLHRDLIFVIHLSAGHHVSPIGRLSFELVAELFGGSAHIAALILLLLQIDLSLALAVLHLILQVVLDLLVLTELDQSVVVSFDLMLFCIFVNHLAPEPILLFILHHANVADLGLAQPVRALAGAHLRDGALLAARGGHHGVHRRFEVRGAPLLTNLREHFLIDAEEGVLRELVLQLQVIRIEFNVSRTRCDAVRDSAAQIRQPEARAVKLELGYPCR